MTDQLEASFDAVVQGERIAGLEGEVAALKGALLAQQRPALDGVKGGAVDPRHAAFVDRYLRQGLEAGVELKSFSGASGAAGGYAVPREIDQIIDATLKGISPIRSIANVVRTGTAGYRKLVTSGGIVSGWASETGARAETAKRRGGWRCCWGGSIRCCGRSRAGRAGGSSMCGWHGPAWRGRARGTGGRRWLITGSALCGGDQF